MSAAKTVLEYSVSADRGELDAMASMTSMARVAVVAAGSVSGCRGLMDVGLVLVSTMVVRVCLGFVGRGKLVLNDCTACNNCCAVI